MVFYKHIIFGEKAKKTKYKIFRHLKKNDFSIDTYLITFPSNPNNLLDIISSNELLQAHYKNSKIQDKLFVIGIAKGKDEAFLIVRDLIDRVYKETGGFNIKAYLGINN